MLDNDQKLTADEVLGEFKKILALVPAQASGAELTKAREKAVYEIVSFMTVHHLSRVDIFTQIYDLACELEIGADYIMRFDEKWQVLVDLIENFDPEAAKKYARTHVS